MRNFVKTTHHAPECHKYLYLVIILKKTQKNHICICIRTPIYFWGQAVIPQISFAYCWIVRSEEKKPLEAA